MTNLRELEKRLETATKSDRHIDAALWSLWDQRPLEEVGAAGAIHKRCKDDSAAFDAPPYYTASLDAAVALVERVLPSNRDDGRVWLQLLDDAVTTALASDAKPNNMARLVCLALIRTLIAKGDRHD